MSWADEIFNYFNPTQNKNTPAPQAASFASQFNPQQQFNMVTPPNQVSPYMPDLTGNTPVGGIPTPGDNDAWTNAFGGKLKNGSTTGGWAAPTVGLLQGGANMYLGMENLGLAKDSLAFQKDAFSKQFEASKSTTNGELYARQEARRSADPNGHMATDEYMSKYGVA